MTEFVGTLWTLVPSEAAADELLVTIRTDVAGVVDAGG